MQNLVGIIRVESELKQALGKIAQFKERAKNARVEGQPAIQSRVAPRAWISTRC